MKRLIVLIPAIYIVVMMQSCGTKEPELPENFPLGPTLEEYGAAQDPPWWPKPCEKPSKP